MSLSKTTITLTPTLWVAGADFYFGESPRWHASTNTLYVSDMIGCKIYTIDTSANRKVLQEVENQPNGMCFLDSNTLIYSSMFDAKLHKYRLDTGKSELYADLSDLMTGYCGDMIIDSAGHVFLDDTGAKILHGETPRPGRLIVVDPRTKKASVAAEDIVFPNGMAIDSSGSILYLAATFSYQLNRFSLDSKTGGLTERQTVWDTHELASLTGKYFERFSGIDGICMDAEDGMWLSMLGYEMFIRRNANGNITHQILVDGHATACTLGGADGKTLFLVVNTLPKGEDLFSAMVGKRTRCNVMTVQVDIGHGRA